MRRADDGLGDVEGESGQPGVQDEETERLRRALDDERDRHLRLRADFDNVRRRASRELADARRDGQRAALLPLLPVLDTLERALAAGSTDPEFYDGVAATYRLFVNALREAGAVPIEGAGSPFDPNVHEAVGTVPSDSVEPGTVLREIRRGWRLGDELLRPAQVFVAAPPGASDSWR